VTLLKSQTGFTNPISSFTGKIQQKYSISMANIPILDKYLKQEKVGGSQDLIFGFSGVNYTAETDFGNFQKTKSRKSYDTVPLINKNSSV
jgi:hypothetical protein